MKSLHGMTLENVKLHLCGSNGIEIAGRILRPDETKSYVEFTLSHAFPVVTCDNTCIHPQVVANSYRTMQDKVFDLAHMLRAYNPKDNPRDYILGCVVAVEFPETPDGGWKVQGDKSRAPGIRGAAVMWKKAENVETILNQYFNGQVDWTVSMEQLFDLGNSAFIVKATGANEDWEEWVKKTPDDLKTLGWTYVPFVEAPNDLLACYDKKTRAVKQYRGCETLLMFGGLNGDVHYNGVGLTPMGKENEAQVVQMLASEKLIKVNGELMPDIIGLLKQTAEILELS
ncbi:MAG TPA: hypothetical protein VH413_16325 [Verrucomicrobiae bacterium]|jgi:hypothetical protein|nr:hypothetical protein [Verrucomicrobiae bacterium]